MDSTILGLVSGVVGVVVYKVIENALPQKIKSEWLRFLLALVITLIIAWAISAVAKWWL